MKPEEPTKIFSVIDDPDWESLLRFLKTLEWESFYMDDVDDGTQWELEFKWEGIKVKSYGSNAYPRGFQKMIGLLNNITKKHGIRASL